MRRFLLVPVLFGLLASSPAAEAATRYIVRFADQGFVPKAPAAAARRVRRSADADAPRFIRRLATGDAVYELATSDPSVLAAIPGVALIEEDKLFHAYATSDPLWPRQWYMHDPRYGTDAEVGWRYTRGAGAVVAVIDTGIVPHAEFDGRLMAGRDFITDAPQARDGDGRDADPTDEGDWYEAGECRRKNASPSSWHGTHVAGLAVAARGNGYGIAGVAPEAMLLPVRVLGQCGAWMSDLVDAVVWASGGVVEGLPPVERRADVLNLSLGFQGGCDAILGEAIAGARARGTAVVAAAGNDAVKANLSAPANCPGVISVGALDRSGAQAWYSNHGEGLTLSAPGGSGSSVEADDMLSAIDAGKRGRERPGFGYEAGTSMAAPLVSGLVALMRSADPDISVDDITRQLMDNARPLQGPCPKGCGAGVMDIGATVDAVVEDRARRGGAR